MPATKTATLEAERAALSLTARAAANLTPAEVAAFRAEFARIDAALSEDSWVCHFTYTWHDGAPEQRRYPRTGQHVGVEWVTSEGAPEGHYTACERCGVAPW